MSDYPDLPFDSAHIRLRKGNNADEIWDIVRKKWLVLTPEEWVRQHYVGYLLTELEYSASSIAVEKRIDVNGNPQRFDALVYVEGKPAILVECKAPKVALTEEVFHQACRYNIYIQAPLVVLTNGLQTIAAQINKSEVTFIPLLPRREDWSPI